jgi:hypothetical protein
MLNPLDAADFMRRAVGEISYSAHEVPFDSGIRRISPSRFLAHRFRVPCKVQNKVQIQEGENPVRFMPLLKQY